MSENTAAVQSPAASTALTDTGVREPSLLAQASPSGSDASPVVGPTGPVYVPDPQPRAAPQGSKQATPDNGNAGNSGTHSGHHRHRGGGSGGGYAGVEGGPTS